jgi:hypothetical protein
MGYLLEGAKPDALVMLKSVNQPKRRIAFPDPLIALFKTVFYARWVSFLTKGAVTVTDPRADLKGTWSVTDVAASH